MGEEVGTASGNRRSSSAVMNRDVVKKRAALWKKQVKSFKLKDVGKKVDAVRFCAQDERFFREQTEVLPLLMGFLSRTKTPELVIETLTVMHTLLSPSTVAETSEPDAEGIHPEINAGFILDRSMSADSAWKAGEPFINLFIMNALTPEIRIKAIEVYDLLLWASVALSAAAGEVTPTLLQFQSAGSPCSSLLGCLTVDNGDLQFAALSCLRSLMRNPPNEEFLSKFETEKGISQSLEFISHLERRFHRPALDILESFSHFDCGREHLKNNGAASVLRYAIREAHEIIKKTSTIVPANGIDASPLSAQDSPLLCANIGVFCQVFVRTTLAKEQVTTSNPVQDDQTTFMDVIDAMVGILQYDIATALTPVAIPSESPRPTGGAAAAVAAANAAAVNAAALTALIPFNIDRCVAIISSLGRMIEFNERCKVHAKAKGLLPVLLDCFKVKEANNLHQVADKLLHLCVHVRDVSDVNNNDPSQQHETGIDGEEHESIPAPETTRIDPQILCAVAAGDVEFNDVDRADGTSPHVNGEHPPLVPVETVLSLLEASHETANKELTFRHLRWIAALIDLPGNANALGERGISLFLQILGDYPDDKLLFAFVAKCIHAVVLQNSGAFEQTSETAKVSEASTVDTDTTFLSQTAEEDSSITKQPDTMKDESGNFCCVEWIDEYEEQAAFDPKPLTEELHKLDMLLAVGEALAALTTAYLKWNSGNGSTPTDFSDLIAAKQDSDHASPGKPGAHPPTGGSKKKLAADQGKPSAVGEAVMLCILEKGMLVPKLVSKYAAINSEVCVALLGLLNNLMTVPSGMKVLLQLAKLELQSADQVETTTSGATEGEWPLSVEQTSRMEHTLLLLPVMNVLLSPDTSFSEIEAAIRSITVMTSDLEPSDKEMQAQVPEPVVEAAKSPTKGGAVAAPVAPPPPSIPELVASESDRFINAALGCGALVVLLAFMDHARIPREADDFSNRVSVMKTQIEEMVHKFITLAQTKQETIITKYREKLLEQAPITDATVPTVVDDDLDLPYQKRWAQLLLDHKFNVSRFGYVGYSALLLASELALPRLVSTLLNDGASPETASPEGLTPLMIAFLVGNEEMVIDLLDARADIDAITTDGQDLTVWNCALVSPVKIRVSNLITKAYTSLEGISSMSARIQLDSIEGSLQYLDMCLDACVDANVSNAQGDFLLHALLSKSIIRRKLRGLDLCFRYNSFNEDQRRLQRAVLELIQAHSANVNSYNRMGQTPLHLALLYGYTGIAEILMNHGANPNVQGVYGHLPLHYACLGFCGNLDGSDGEAVEITRLLLEHAQKYTCTVGAHNDRRKHKAPAEKQALAIENILENGLQSVIEPQSIVQQLASSQQILTTPSFLGKFLPWHFACGAYIQLSSVLCLDDDMQTWFEANGQARADILRYLLREWKIDISASASNGVTALHLAMKSDVNGNNFPVIDLLLENSGSGSMINVNAVHEHILIDSLPVIPSGAQVAFVDNSQDVKQAFVSSRSIVGKYHIILTDGKHLDDISRDQLQVIYDPDKRTAHHSHHYKYLLPMESRFSALHYALQSNHDTLALRLLALPGISLEPEGSDLPLLALACAARQSPEVVGKLITEQANMRVHLPLRTSKCDLTTVDADTSSNIANRKHAAALHYAVMYDDLPMVEVLLTSPGDHVHPNVKRSRDGFTPLHLACQMENMRAIKLLLEHGASLTQLSSMSAHGVSPLQLLMKFDSMENDKLKELISENYLRPEMLLQGFTEQHKSECQPDEGQNNEGENYDNPPSCALLLEEEHNCDLFERLQGLKREKRGSNEALKRRLESKLEKSDAVLGLFFDLIRRPKETNDSAQIHHQDLQQSGAHLMEIFQQLRHQHECYIQFTTRSQWKPRTKMPRGVIMTLTLDEGRTEEDMKCPRPPQVPQLKLNAIQADKSTEISELEHQDVRRLSLGSIFLPPVHPNTTREESNENVDIASRSNQTARIRFAPRPMSKQRVSSGSTRPGRAHLVGRSATFCGTTCDLQQKKLATTRSFKTLKTLQQSLEPGVLKTLLAEVHHVLYDAIYRKPDDGYALESASSTSSSTTELFECATSTLTGENNTLEYFTLVADLQEKVELQQQERKRLTTQLEMGHSLEQDLSDQLQQLERELTQLHMRHAYNRAEIEGERRAVQILERDYASLTEQEQELLRDCELSELQLDTQRTQLKEIRSQQLYLDFVSSAPLKWHMEEKKWQEQHAAVALQVQNAEVENRSLEDEIRNLEEETSKLEEQYARDVQTKHQSETALSEVQVNFEQFQEALERTRNCYTPRPDWDRIVDETPELSVQKYQWGIVESESDVPTSTNNGTDDKDKGGVLERLDSINNIANREGEHKSNSSGRTKALVKEMLHWIERLQKHCGVNLHLSRIWHDVEEARVELNILHHQLDRAVRKTSMLPIVFPNMSGVITIAAATSPTSGSPSKRRQDYIMGLGMHEGVPLFLRHRGKLKRRILKKVDVEKVVRKVWVEKRKREQRNPLGRYPLDQVLYEKLHRKYGFQPLIAEWGYNLLLALQMFSWDSEIEMFLLCLTGAVSDLVYVDQEQMILGCQQILLRLCELYNVESFVTERRVLLKDALVALRTFFPLKTSAQLQAIEQAIIRDMHKMKRGGNDSILYIEDILPLDVKYPLGFFVKTIRTQHFKEIQDYYALLLSELEQRDTEQRGILPLAAVRDSILAIDPLADPNTVQNLIMKALNIKTRVQLHMREHVLYKAALRKMNATCLMKFALNFDQNAEINWRRRPGAVYVEATTANIPNTEKSIQDNEC